MATITACTPTSSVAGATLLHRGSKVVSSSPVLGLPAMAKKGKVSCSMEGKPSVQESSLNVGMGASLMAAAYAATMSSPAMALVDERMSTEGTGLPFGLSNNVLVWILLAEMGGALIAEKAYVCYFELRSLN
ncbi:hypothetical protein F0562_021183 [Nyssa sinensis]|uniref:PSII 6.1 kDa protein n=1 Tax=Nyssa sinensis TaxID=561372 RepID=A0A5J5BNQ2_9ASTE|nr:hypothetical protein F0562_021183 [Nyssa sinensis]